MDPNEDGRLVESLAATAASLINADIVRDRDQLLVQIVHSAVETVPGADAAGITLATRKEIESRAPFNDEIRELDQIQIKLGQGPCLRALNDPPR